MVDRSSTAAHSVRLLSSFRPIKRDQVYELVVQTIQKSLASGDLKPGEKLPPERHLAAALGISRPSLREALRLLEAMGVIDRKPGGGTYAKTPEPPRLLVSFTPILPGQHDFLFETLELRRILEPAIARMAAERATRTDIETMRHILTLHDERVRRRESAMEEDAAFHRAIAAATHNSVVLRAMDSINDLLQEWRAIWVQGRPARSVTAHQRILAALTRRNGHAAERAMNVHLRELDRAIRRSPRKAVPVSRKRAGAQRHLRAIPGAQRRP